MYAPCRVTAFYAAMLRSPTEIRLQLPPSPIALKI